MLKKIRARTRRRKHPKLLGLYARPSRQLTVLLGVIPFVVMFTAYLIASSLRHAANADDKLLPTLWQMAMAIAEFSYNSDEELGGPIMQFIWNPETLSGLRAVVCGFLYSNLLIDTVSSLSRIMAGLSLSTVCGLLIGLNMGLFIGFRQLLRPFMIVILSVPPIAVLPIILVIFQVGELAKVMLIFIGTFPVITMSVFLAVKAIPWEMIIKAQTLGATQLGVVYRVVLPMTMPNLLNVVGISLGASWLFLITSEAIAATMGLGYRIFLVRRYMSMDIIIPYVVLITILAVLLTWSISRFIAKHYRWFNAQNGGGK